MKLIIAGGRDIHAGQSFISGSLELLGLQDKVSKIVCGCANGIDNAGKYWGWQNRVLVELFPADWDKHGKAAGPIRNREMALYADALLLIWDGKSKGSANMKKEMTALGKPIYEVILKKP